MKVKDIMTRGSACCTSEQTARDAVRAMEEHNCGCVPVEDASSKRVVGVVTDRDIALRVVGQGRSPDTALRDILSDNPSCCAADDDVEVAQQIMSERQVRRVPVIDKDGKAVGMVAQADLATHRGRLGDEDVARVVDRISRPTGASRRETPVGRQVSLH
jgi:CBS domain-containing protein